MLTRILIIIFLAIPCLSQGDDQYRIRFSDDLSLVSVEACFEGSAPAYLYRNEDAAPFASSIRVDKLELNFDSDSRRIKLGDLPRDACVQWSVDLAAAAAGSDYRLAMKMDHGYITSGNLWFWRDADHRPILIEVDLPAGLSFSTPWPVAEFDPAKPIFRPQATPASWSSRIAIGKFPITEVKLGDSRLMIATIGTTEKQSADLSAWIHTSAESVASVSGKFPQKTAQILIIAIGPRNGPVPWAHVLRGGGIASEFFVDESRPFHEFVQDWKAPHELSHMLLPYVSSKDRWLSEGLATYYENVLRSRQGSITEEQAWLKLHKGFERGRAATKGGTLAGATRSGRAATMRVYWSGAAIMLKADTQLRSISGGSQSLDRTLAKLQNCCLDQGRTWTALELFKRMDEINDNQVFMGLYEQHVSVEGFPDVELVYEHLGLVVDAESILVQENARGSQIRYLIMNTESGNTESGNTESGNTDSGDQMPAPSVHSSGGK